ncbi:MAG: ArsR/SmtB family transcription factor [Desulfobacteraceae bacterium]
MKSFTRVMKALSEPNRVKIIKLLQHRGMCVCEIREALGISQPSASKHLRILGEAGLVESRRDGLWVNYFPSDGASSPYASTIMGNLRHWLEEGPEVQELIRILPSIHRDTVCRR